MCCHCCVNWRGPPVGLCFGVQNADRVSGSIWVVDLEGPLIADIVLSHKQALDLSHCLLVARRDIGVRDLDRHREVVSTSALVVLALKVVVIVFLERDPVRESPVGNSEVLAVTTVVILRIDEFLASRIE